MGSVVNKSQEFTQSICLESELTNNILLQIRDVLFSQYSRLRMIQSTIPQNRFELISLGSIRLGKDCAELIGPEQNFYYLGGWKNIQQGYGCQLYKCGEYYVGNFLNGKANGEGIYCIGSQNVMFKGEWKNNLQEGYGEELFINYSRYCGNYSKGQKDGYGELEWADGDFFKGTFKQNKMVKGEMKYSNGCSYTGEFKAGMMDGQGTLVTVDGSYYQGTFKGGKKQGQGQFKDYNEKSITCGIWDNDQLLKQSKKVQFE